MVDEQTILAAVVQRLQDALLLPDGRCFLTVEPLSGAGAPAGGDYWLTVSPGDSDFDQGLQYGGGANQVTENATCIVTGYTRIRLDPTARDDRLLKDLQKGLLPIKQKILAAMLADPAQLTDELGNPLLRSFITAIGSQKPNHDRDKGVGWVGVVFSIPFDWDLSDAL